ncbi:hypothetical protein K2Q00_02460 [Patescibacteria group bacterium]|nr:hypothetical protein [Patescibacteria group bacterium]
MNSADIIRKYGDGLKKYLDDAIKERITEEDRFFPYLISLEIALLLGGIAALSTWSIEQSKITSVLVLASILCMALSIFLRLWYVSRRDYRYKVFQGRQKESLKKAEDFFSQMFDLLKDNASLKAEISVLKKNTDSKEFDKERFIKETADEVMNEFGGKFSFISELLKNFISTETRNNSRSAFKTPLEEKLSKSKLIMDDLSELVKNKLLLAGGMMLVIAVTVHVLI